MQGTPRLIQIQFRRRPFPLWRRRRRIKSHGRQRAFENRVRYVCVGVDGVVDGVERLEVGDWWAGEEFPLCGGERVELLPPDVGYVVVRGGAVVSVGVVRWVGLGVSADSLFYVIVVRASVNETSHTVGVETTSDKHILGLT